MDDVDDRVDDGHVNAVAVREGKHGQTGFHALRGLL